MTAKKLLCGWSLLAIAVSAAGMIPEPEIHPGTPRTERRIQTGSQTVMVLNARTEIVLPEQSVPVAVFAAKELQDILSQAVGRKLPIVKVPSPNTVSIIVGDNQFSRKLGINLEGLERDAFQIKTGDRRIAIAGQDDPHAVPEAFLSDQFARGTLFGVYDFLERVAGVRFYFPGDIGTIIPELREIKVTSLDIQDRPDHIQRRVYNGRCKWFDDTLPARFGIMLQGYRNRMQTAYIPNCHSLERLGYLERFGKTHPEYFALDEHGQRYLERSHPSAGSLCLSNSGFRNELYLDAVSYLKGEPASLRGVQSKGKSNWDGSCFRPGYFNIMPGDWHRPCQCGTCREFRERNGASEWVWDLVRSIAGKLKKNRIAGSITAMAYAFYNTVPRQPVPDNVEVMVAVTGPWADRDPQLCRKENQLIADWNRKLGRKVWLWTYPMKYGASELPGIPAMAPRLTGTYYRRIASQVFGTFMECETDEWIFNYLNQYIYGKVSWDNAADVEALLAEHDKLMFGSAAAIMRNFYDALEQIWVKQLLGKQTMTAQGPVNIPPSNYEIWEKIYSRNTLQELDSLLKRAEETASSSPSHLKRIRFMRAKLLSPIESASRRYWKEKEALNDWLFPVRSLNPDESILIDGKLDEAAWKNGKPVYLLPFRNGKQEVNTLVHARIDKKYLYFGFECCEPAIDRMIVRQQQRDHAEVWRDSAVEILLNPSDDGRNYYHFMINADGVISDAKAIRSGAVSQFDSAWNSSAAVKTARQGDRWTLEAAIPLSDLPGFNRQGFKANFGRHRAIAPPIPDTMLYTWSPFVTGFHDVENFGKLIFASLPAESEVRNGDFTAPLKGSWSVPAGNVSIDAETFMTGGRSLKLSGSGTLSIHQNLPKLKPDTSYLLSFYIRLDQVVPLKKNGGAAVLLGDNQNNWFPNISLTGTMPWTRQGYVWKTRSDTNRLPGRFACIRLYLLNASGTVWFDGVRLTELAKDTQTNKE